MRRRQFLMVMGGAAATLATAPAALAKGVADDIVRQLKAQGYTDFSVSRTLLGRTRIVASSGGREREIIVDPRTGEILRDLWRGNSGRGRLLDDDRDGGSDGRDSAADDKGGDDGSDDDNSGSGSSGSGSSGSGSSGNSGSGSSDDDSNDDSDDGSDDSDDD